MRAAINRGSPHRAALPHVAPFEFVIIFVASAICRVRVLVYMPVILAWQVGTVGLSMFLFKECLYRTGLSFFFYESNICSLPPVYRFLAVCLHK